MREPLAGTTGVPPGSPAAFRQARARCRACGEPWFGEVAYCPYCGRSSASPLRGPTMRLFAARAGADGAAGTGSMSWWKPVAIGAVVGALVVATGELVRTALSRPEAQSATRARGGEAVRSQSIEATAGKGKSEPAASAPAASAPPAASPRPPVAAAPAPPVARGAEASPPAPQPAPEPAARHRSLCSAANEAAGLCNPR